MPIGKYASIEFDLARHPNQLPMLVTINQLRHEKVDDHNLPIDGLSRAEIALPQDLIQWVSMILSGDSHYEHERSTFFNQL